MAEYIKREYAVDAVLGVYYDTPDIDLSGEKFEDAILKIPAADVTPVRHGQWLLDGSCSECLANPLTTHKKYCPNCGAKMDGGADI